MKSHHWGTGSKISRQCNRGIFVDWDVQEEFCTTGGRVHIQVWCTFFPNTFFDIPTPEDGPLVSWNVRYQLPSDVVSHPTRTNTSVTQLQKPKNLNSLLYFEEPIMSPYAPDAPQPHIIFMIHFITTLPFMSGTLKADTLLWLGFVTHFSRLSCLLHALLIILLMLGNRQTLWSSKQEPFSKIIQGHRWKTLNTGGCFVTFVTKLSQPHRSYNN